MIVLTIRTDNPVAELGLYDDGRQIAYITWEAHRQLAETLHQKIAEILASRQLDWSAIYGIVAYKGPGSFTGLRIGISVANALAAGLGTKLIGAVGDDWQPHGIRALEQGESVPVVVPEYGAQVHITTPRK